MIDVETEINKHKNCRDRDELGRQIKEYKKLALKYASNFTLAGQYNMVAQKLQGICDKLPAPNLIHRSGNAPSVPVKTVTLTNEDEAEINAAWEQKAGNKQGGVKR